MGTEVHPGEAEGRPPHVDAGVRARGIEIEGALSSHICPSGGPLNIVLRGRMVPSSTLSHFLSPCVLKTDSHTTGGAVEVGARAQALNTVDMSHDIDVQVGASTRGMMGEARQA